MDCYMIDGALQKKTGWVANRINDIASTPCQLCGLAIGYNTRFYVGYFNGRIGGDREPECGLAHADCVEV